VLDYTGNRLRDEYPEMLSDFGVTAIPFLFPKVTKGPLRAGLFWFFRQAARPYGRRWSWIRSSEAGADSRVCNERLMSV
jgi:hypothetical protein